ncbi:hypothetical protein [Nocardioides nitrophenolicus]|uniref:hypothetical protein n=1 Tax=Nocardioides nitrophenolicus TaxID=60489 RepID=UPI001959611B|nr:hypothetical protein [Nocardioides nitrophenolicus]MBM7516060.1 hypothetical protein [Nocardioides nitrophenolicus]
MSPRIFLRLALAALAAAVGLAPLLAPAPAHAGQVGVTIGITGAGRVEVVEGSIEDGGGTACDRTSNLDHRVTLTCARIRNEEPFEAWVWLRPSFFGVPAGWEFVEWEGCDETRSNSSGTRDCAVHSGAFSTVDKYPVAVFRDVDPPEITGFTPTQVVNQQGGFKFAFSARGAVRIHCKLDYGAWEPCTSPRTLVLPEGPHLFAIQAEDASGNLSHSFSVQVHSIDTGFTAKPPKLSNSRSADFAFTSAGGTAFDCVLDGYPFTCDSGEGHFADLADGTHTLSVAGRNGTWVDPVPAQYEWTVDATAPETTLSGGPVEGSTSFDTTATFTLDAPGATTFYCTIDGAGTPCDRGQVVLTGLAPGPHRFEATSRDEAGNRDQTAAVRRWTIGVRDRTAPDTTLNGGPAEGSVVTTTEATFEVGTTEPGSRTTCTLDGADLPCPVGPLSLTGLTPGTHVLTATATDAAGNTDPSAATRTWTVPVPAAALKRKGRTLSLRVTDARRLALVVSTGRRPGKVKVYAGRRLVSKLSLQRATPTRVVDLTSFTSPWSGKVRIVVVSRRGTVRVEGVAAPTR